MAIDPSLLIAAPMLQDYFVDNVTGQAMSGGIITCYKDNSRTTLKNWYYQTGAPGNYTYLPLPNPLVLSDAGTIEDANGVDTIPFFYPYSEANSTVKEPYYITVVNSDLQAQFTRANFPFNPSDTPSGAQNSTNNNLIINNEFWRNVGSVDASDLSGQSISINGSPLYYTTIAPSQHDGLPVMSDIQFFKNANDATDTITFNRFVEDFANQIIPDSITPEYYLNFNCSGIGTETSKYFQIPIQLHVESLSGVQNCSITLAAMALTGNPSITVSVFQYLGDGVASPIVIPVETFQLSNTWDKYITIPFTMPSAQGLTLGNGGDDALYLQIGLPVGADGICNINLALPSVYLSDEIPTDDFKTYDQINAIISSPRTGDVRLSLNDFYYFGWVPMNNGTIGYNSDEMAAYLPTARNNKDTWPLYNLLWNKFHTYTNGSVNVLAQLIDDTGANVAYGSTAISDFNANKSLTLTQTMGKVLLGTASVESLLASYRTTFTAANSGGNLQIVADNNMSLFNGMPIVFSGNSLPSTINATTVYYVSSFNGSTTFLVSTSFANAMAGTYVSFASGSGTVTSALDGTFEGEYAHTQLEREVGPHIHNSAAGQFDINIGAGGTSNFVAGDQNTSTPTTGGVNRNAGAQLPFNVTQPGAFFNIYMKL